MNAYELADGLRTIGAMPSYEVQIFLMKTETMLRQQADRITELEFQIRMNEMKYLEKIEELEKINQEPVAWLYFDDLNKLKLAQTSPPDPYMFPVYTHPHKELSDEEIDIVAEKMADMYNQLRAKESGSRGYAEQCDTMKTIYNAIIKASRGEE